MTKSARFARAQVFVLDHMPALITAGMCVIAAVVLIVLLAHQRNKHRTQTVTTEIGAQVGTTQLQEADAIGAATEETRGEITQVQDRTRRDVARVRAAAPRSVVVGSPGHVGADPVERAFFDGVCASPLYVANPACRGDGRGSEDPGPAPRP